MGLLEKINILYDMELNNYLMKKAISKLDSDIEHKNYDIELEFIPPQYKSVEEAKGHSVGGIIISVIASLFLAFLGFLIGSLVLSIVVFIVAMIIFMLPKNNQKKIEEENKKIYERAKSEHHWKISRLEKKHEVFLISQKDILSKKLDESQSKLEEMYNLVGIEEKFRNIIAIGYMAEYLKFKIATKLEGPGELYDRVMQDIRWDKLGEVLNDISNKLDTIIDNQHTLAYELREMNNKCDEIVGGLGNVSVLLEENNELQKEIAENTSISAYYNERVSKEYTYYSILSQL